MPEAPEVQHTLNGISSLLKHGRVDRYCSLHWTFKQLPLNMKIDVLHRHGKWIVIGSRERAVMLHLGMSGSFVIGGPLRRNLRWCAMIEGTRERRLLQFVDPRCMGRIRLLDRYDSRVVTHPTARTLGCPSIGLGPDVMSSTFSDGTALSTVNRWSTLLDRPSELKCALMAQHVVAGLGNIYAAEACWLARVSPYRVANTLTRRELQALSREVPLMLIRALYLGGTSFGDANSFRDVDGVEGGNGKLLRVYGRAGQICNRCGELIIRSPQRGRSTFWCPGCQAE